MWDMLEADLYEARWKGTTDLDQEARGETSLDGLAFAIVAIRVEELGAMKLTKDGKRRRKDVFNIEDARMLSGDLREQAVQFLAARVQGDQQSFAELGPADDEPSWRGLPAAAVEEDADDAPSATITALNQQPQADAEDDPFESDSGTVVVGSVHDYKKGARPEPSGGDGPRVGRFDPDAIDGVPAPSGVERVGSVRPAGYKGKDSALRKFLEEA